MNIFLAGTYSRPYVFTGEKTTNMKIYLAGEHEVKNGSLADWGGIDILESFIYARDNKYFMPLMRHNDVNLILDSGAFTFMSNKDMKLNWEKYVGEYCEFVLTYGIKLFFELDIDVVTGIKHVERLRKIIEQKTGIQPIPVWHKSRGLDYWKGMVKDYKYVAIGGIVTKEIKRTEHRIFTNLINIAKEHGAKVHGLGYTNLQGLKKYKFDSVDSTSWLYGNRSGTVYKFNGETIIQIDKPAGTRLNARAVAINNFKEWVKFQQYAKRNL